MGKSFDGVLMNPLFCDGVGTCYRDSCLFRKMQLYYPQTLADPGVFEWGGGQNQLGCLRGRCKLSAEPLEAIDFYHLKGDLIPFKNISSQIIFQLFNNLYISFHSISTLNYFIIANYVFILYSRIILRIAILFTKIDFTYIYVIMMIVQTYMFVLSSL